MPTFNFQGRDIEGKLISGKRLSQTTESLASQLLNEGIVPVNIFELKNNNSFINFFKNRFHNGNATLDEMSLFSRQMYALTKTGVTITAALKQLAENARSPKMADALYGLVEDLESGLDLAASMQHYPHIFTPIMISMIRVGQSSGRIDEAFLCLNQYLELEASAFKRIKTVLRYPMIVLSAMFFAAIFITIFVIPSFVKIFAQSNLQLPAITLAMMNFSSFIINHWVLILLLLSGGIAVTYHYFNSPKGALIWDRFIFKIPIFGGIIRRVVLLRFAQTFAITINSGVPLLEGLSLVAQSINNSYAEHEIDLMRDLIQHGKNITQAAANTHLFTTLELQMLSVSEETGELGKMLDEIAVFYRREVDYDLKRLNDIIEPVLLIVLAVMVLLLAFSVYLPIWDMVNLVHA